MSVKLYFDKMSQPSRAVLMFVRANKPALRNKSAIPFEEVPVALRKGEHLTKEFAQINPFKRVPLIDHNGFILKESVAILRYLCRTFPVADHWYPTDSKQMARVDEYMAWQHLTLRLNGSMFFQTKVIIPKMKGQPINEKRATFYGDQLKLVLGQLENIWLKERPFVAGKELSIADLLAVTELEQPGMGGYDVRGGHPRVSEYMERVRERLQPHYDDVHAVVRVTEKRFSEGKL